jgi:type II secretory pathway component PulJ
MRPATNPTRSSRRGVTLVEMMVAVGLLVLMMSVIVAVFQSATGAIQEQRAFAALDQELRRIDSIIRMDLGGVTAQMTPPNDPGQKQGYFEYAENALADSQGEDSDDTLRFTAKAPDGQPFVGNLWLPASVPATDNRYVNAALPTLYPVRVTSQYAEIVYFLRNGNLYRRVVLIKPQLASSAQAFVNPPFVGNTPQDPELYNGLFTPNVRTGPTFFGFRTNIFTPATEFAGGTYAGTMTVLGFPFVSWPGMNDLSARPSAFPTSYAGYPDPTQVPIGSYAPVPNTLGDLTPRENRIFNPRAVDDWVNNANPLTVTVPDGLPDDENDMDGNGAPFEGDGVPDYPPILYPSIFSPTNAIANNQLVWEFNNLGGIATTPRVTPNYDNMAFPYLYPYAYSVADFPSSSIGMVHSLDPTVSPVGTNANPYFGTFLSPPFNHNPIDLGDSLPGPGGLQTWWGFPTKRETSSPFWLDPIKRLNDPATATYFAALGPMSGSESLGAGYQAAPLSWYRRLNSPANQVPWLPWLNAASTPYPTAQPYADATGSGYFVLPPNAVWEEDLLATNVRSFDVKALDVNAKMVNPATNGIVYLPPGYYDLGYGNMLSGTNPLFLDSFAHEGRMPPLTTDYRSNPQFPALQPNIGDDNATVLRMRRTWDSWSTTYSNVPSVPRIPFNGPLAGLPPTFPSYPAPYPAALRGIQIQVRLASPDGQRVKTLTIQQDFTDKL